MAYSSITKNSGAVESTEGLPIYYDLYFPDNSGNSSLPVIVFLHGFKGFKDWGPFPKACKEISRSGFGVVAMNFSLNGVGENPTVFDQLDYFARETLSQDLDDVGSIINALNEGKMESGNITLDTDMIGILGHSRGGQTAVAAAAEFNEIKCLATWSAVADYNQRWSDKMIEEWENQGYTEIKNSRTGQSMRIDKVVYDDAREHAERVIALNRIKNLHIPVLIVHATDDESVPVFESDKLHKACPSTDKELKKVPGTGHTFGTGHPFEGGEFPEPFREVLDSTKQWFEYYL